MININNEQGIRLSPDNCGMYSIVIWLYGPMLVWRGGEILQRI